MLFAANRGYTLTSSREALLRRFIERDWRVVLATADDTEARHLVSMGAHLEPVDFNRGGLALSADIHAYRRMVQVYRDWQPVLAHHFNAKPAIAGTLAARRALGRQVHVINTITGLGHAFVAGGVTSHVAGLGYRLALPRAEATVFQNSDDRELFLKRDWLDEARARLIVGSGVDVDRFGLRDRAGRDGRAPVVVMVGRLLRQKGIPEFVEVAHRIRQRWPGARFCLAGEEDAVHPQGVTAAWVREQGGVEYVGRLADVVPLLAEADLLLFPSYYREGVPRVVMEAAATGLPTVAFDVPGVREAVDDSETGYLCPDRDVDALTARVSELLEDEALRLRMGQAARRMVEARFDIRAIQGQYLDLYREAGFEV